MAATRRDVLKGAGVLAGASAFPIVFRGGVAYADVDPATQLRRRLVVVFLAGGNDGLNTVIPVGNVTGGARRDVYDAIRPVVGVPAANTLALTRTPADAAHQVGLNPNLTALKGLYDSGRLAIVQGADYPGHSYSHFDSQDYWMSGQPQDTVTSGWLGRHLDRVGIPNGELRGLAIARDLPLALHGDPSVGRIESAVAFDSLAAVRFADGASAEALARHSAYRMFGGHPSVEVLRHYYGVKADETVDLVEAVAPIPLPPNTGSYLGNQLLNARTMLSNNLGVEVVFVIHYGGYDTHVDQVLHHAAILRELDLAIESFYYGTRDGVAVPGAGAMDSALASRTLVMTFSEFGRTMGDNGQGTDHGAAGPMFLIGPPTPAPGSGVPALVPGLHGAHPNMGTVAVPATDVQMTTDVRQVYQAVLTSWLADPDDTYYTPRGITPLSGLFTTA
jgi:uncharacterized protein (DUF1501 family)